MDGNTFSDHNKILILSLFQLQSYNEFFKEVAYSGWQRLFNGKINTNDSINIIKF